MRKISSSSISDSELDFSSSPVWELDSGSGSGWEPDSGSEFEPESLFPWNAPRAEYNKKNFNYLPPAQSRSSSWHKISSSSVLI